MDDFCRTREDVRGMSVEAGVVVLRYWSKDIRVILWKERSIYEVLVSVVSRAPLINGDV